MRILHLSDTHGLHQMGEPYSVQIWTQKKSLAIVSKNQQIIANFAKTCKNWQEFKIGITGRFS